MTLFVYQGYPNTLSGAYFPPATASMPHSTTGTTSYVLVKYSRAYPTKRTMQNTQSGSELTSEWQHFTNPIIRVMLDVTRSSKENIESVRLRILWQINNEPDTFNNNQPDVVFEDLDLLSFSLDMVSSNARKQILESLPLKAVYRDTVVGIRYLHPRDASAEVATYRRFQISFQSAGEASEFIDSIKPVCPCKMNPTPVPPNLNLQPQIVPRPANPVSVAQMQSARNPMTMTDHLTFVHPPTSSHQYPPPGPTDATNRLQPIIPSSTPYILSSSPPPRHTNADTRSVTNSNPPTQTTHAPTPTEITYRMQSQMQSVLPRNNHQGNSSGPESTNLPASSLPTPSSDSTCGSTQLPRSDAPGRLDTIMIVHHEPAQSVLASLSDAASIYNLPTSTLERVIGEVIREEGFLQLVERVSEMFTIRKAADV